MILERGEDVDTRQADVEAFWQTGRLKPDSNVQFGEGGAGTFSDGKLNTLVRDKYGRNTEVLKTFVRHGADPSIVYQAKPHIGTDVLSRVIKSMREEILRLGGEVRFKSQVTEIKTQNGQVTGVIVNGRKRFPVSRWYWLRDTVPEILLPCYMRKISPWRRNLLQLDSAWSIHRT